jgi:hypothetical protein
MITKAHARALRRLIEQASENLTDTEALEGIELFPKWKTDETYLINERVRYEYTLYKCLMNHTSQETWTPPVSPSLWVRVDDPGEEWPEWRQPTGSTDAYPKGAKVSHNGKHWTSDIDANVYEPGVYGWTEK